MQHGRARHAKPGPNPPPRREPSDDGEAAREHASSTPDFFPPRDKRKQQKQKKTKCLRFTSGVFTAIRSKKGATLSGARPRRRRARYIHMVPKNKQYIALKEEKLVYRNTLQSDVDVL